MSTDTPPVVECVVRFDREDEEWQVDEAYDDVRNGDVPALAVPVALFADEAFVEAVRIRAWNTKHASPGQPGLPQARDYAAAIHAELRACAGKP